MRLLLCLIALLPAPLFAACPTASDMTRGVIFDVGDGDTESYRLLENGLIESVYTDATGGASRVTLVQGVYLAEVADLVDGLVDPKTRSTYRYPMLNAEMPAPVSGQSWDVTVTVSDGQGSFSEYNAFTFGQTALLNFGSCEYEMIPVEARFGDKPGPDFDLLYYLPALGFSYLAETTFEGKTDAFHYHALRTME